MNKPVGNSNPFLRATQELVATGEIRRTREATPPTRSPRARANFIPDDDTLFGLIEQALRALARGHYWDRGAILNIQV